MLGTSISKIVVTMILGAIFAMTTVASGQAVVGERQGSVFATTLRTAEGREFSCDSFQKNKVIFRLVIRALPLLKPQRSKRFGNH